MLSVAVIDDFSLARTASNDEAPEPIFQAGSISKALAAFTALMLVENGFLDLDSDVNDALVSWRVPGEGVTLRQLLSHTSGLTTEFFPGYEQGEDVPSAVAVLDGRPPASTEPVRLVESARGSFRYSGGAYVVVQKLLADVAGTSFAELAAELALEPLGMHDSTFEQPLPVRLHARAARLDWNVYPEAAAAGLWTTASDLARFALELQRAVAGRASAVSRDIAALMLTPQVEIPSSPDFEAMRSLGVEPPDRMGLGLFLAERAGRFGHLGGATGFTSAIDASVRDGTGVVVMSNVGNDHETVLGAVAARPRKSVA